LRDPAGQAAAVRGLSEHLEFSRLAGSVRAVPELRDSHEGDPRYADAHAIVAHRVLLLSSAIVALAANN
jgi:hypothetical protein